MDLLYCLTEDNDIVKIVDGDTGFLLLKNKKIPVKVDSEPHEEGSEIRYSVLVPKKLINNGVLK